MANTLASLGQRYQDYPAATFAERFGPYETGPLNDQQLMRKLLEQEQQRRIPEMIVPGTKTYPHGYTLTELGERPMQLAGDVVNGPLPLTQGGWVNATGSVAGRQSGWWNNVLTPSSTPPYISILPVPHPQYGRPYGYRG